MYQHIFFPLLLNYNFNFFSLTIINYEVEGLDPDFQIAGRHNDAAVHGLPEVHRQVDAVLLVGALPGFLARSFLGTAGESIEIRVH
jgi:hypothetical protein